MGRRSSRSLAAVTGDSSPSSAESSFRELDDAFLQNQTRIWLGEVLNSRLDEKVHISDLLADGELLCQVSKVIWNLLLTKCVELWQLKANLKGPILSRKSSGRYMPYSNVDSFLKICKILGLNGIDLFSPSDVVEKRSTRKVCVCIRALSKKARSKQLQVPDFDVVTYAVAMPTDMVGCIRRSLESSQSSFSSSSSYYSHKQSRRDFGQKISISGGDKNDDACSEESDEAESNFVAPVSHFSSIYKLQAAAAIHSDLLSPGAFSSTASQYGIEAQNVSKYDKDLYKSQQVSRFVKPSSKHATNTHLAENMSFCDVNPRRKLYDKVPFQNDDILHNQSNSVTDCDPAFQNDDLVTEDNLGDSTAERDYISEYLAFSDSVVLKTGCSSPLLFDGEENTYNFFMGIDAHGSNFKGRIYKNGDQRRDSDIDDEVSSTTSMSSVLGRVLNMEFDDRFDLDDTWAAKDHPKRLLESKTNEKRDNGSLRVCKSQGMNEYETLSPGFTYQVENLGLCPEFSVPDHHEQPSILESQDILSSSCSHRSTEEDLHLDDIILLDTAKGSVRDEDTDRVTDRVDGNMFGSDCRTAQSSAGDCGNVSDMRSKDSNSSCHKISVEGNTRRDCKLHHDDRVTCHLSSQETFDSAEVLRKTIIRDSNEICPPECILLKEVCPHSSAEFVDNASKGGLQACSSLVNVLDSGEYTNQDDKIQQHIDMVEDVLGWKRDSTGESSCDKPHQKLLKTVAKGTAIIGVLFIFLQVGRRIGDKNGKAGKKTGQMQNISHSDSSTQKDRKWGKANGIYPAEKLKI